MSRFNYGICEWSLKERGKQLCKTISEVGLTCFQVGVGVETLQNDGLADSRNIEQYLDAAAEFGLVISCVVPTALDYYSFCKPETQEEEETADKLIDMTIDLSETFGCKSFLLPALNRGAIVDSRSFHKAVHKIKKYCEKAAEKGVMTLFESTLGVKQTIDVMEAVDHPQFQLFFDSQNPYLFDGTFAAGWFRELSDHIKEIHVKDGLGTDMSGALLGHGSSGFIKTAKAIIESDFSGNILLENYYQNPPLCFEGYYKDLLRLDVDILKKTFDN